MVKTVPNAIKIKILYLIIHQTHATAKKVILLKIDYAHYVNTQSLAVLNVTKKDPNALDAIKLNILF